MHSRWNCPCALLFGLLLVGCAKDATKNGDAGAATANTDDTAAKSIEKSDPQADLAVVRGTGDLGSADYGEKRSTAFTIKNNTRKSVTLELIHKTCFCSAIDIKPTDVLAGGTAEVTMTWAPKFQPSERQTDTDLLRAVIRAKNDPKMEVTLEARGRVAPGLHVSLPRGRLEFERIELGDLKAGKKELAAIIYTKDSKHKGFTVAAQSSNPGIKLVPPEPARLDAVELARLGATDGYRLNIRCGEGLPVGSFHEIVRVKSSVYPNQELELAVEGFIEAGAVSINPVAQFKLPEKVDLATGYKCAPITVTLNFEAGRTLTLDKAEPALLQVSVRKVKDNVWQIDALVPAGEAEIRKLLSPAQAEEFLLTGWDRGVVTFKTDHSLVPVLKIPVDASQFKR